ncbi:MAG: amidohydrolase family protein [Proteobacteria bacterium]|nr:amidohydrolase family protein [Pseudomonadota bacterium]MBU1740841.1 amidohydrolase family protein [Pseudomonadota bacterium]
MIDRYWLKAGWLIDGAGTPAQSNVLVEIREGVIVGLADGAGGERPDPGLDFSESTLTPALVDAHVHLFMSPIADEAARRRQLSARYDDLKPVMTRHARDLIRAGVLAVRDGGDYGGFSLRLRDEFGPGYPLTVRAPGRAWHARGRYGKLIGRAVGGADLAGAVADEAARIDHVKVVNSGLNSLTRFGRPTAPQFETSDLARAVQAAARRGLKTMVHANGAEPVRRAVVAGGHSIEHGFFMGSELLSLMRDRGCVWVPTTVTMKGYAETLPPGDPRADVARRNLEHQIEQVSRARSLGVQVACGTDAGTLGVAHGPSIFEEMSLLLAAGFSLEEAVAAASVAGAELLGVEDHLGPLAPGRPATWLVFDQTPVEMARALRPPSQVFVNGAPVQEE